MKKHLLMLPLLVFAFLYSHAQVVRHLQPDSIINVVPDGRHSLYTIGGKLVTPEEVQFRLMSYAPSATEYHAAKSDFVWGYSLSIASGLSSSGAILAFAHDNKINGATIDHNTGQFVYQNHNKTGAYILTGAAVGLLTAAIIRFVHGSRHAGRAFWIYNQQYQ